MNVVALPSQHATTPLPQNLDAEASILGGVILRNETLALVPELELDDFSHYPHKVVFEAMRNLERAHKPIDIVTLENEIEVAGKLDAIGGVAFLGELAMRVPTPDNVRTYADDVRLHTRNRTAILTLSEALARARKWPHDADELVSETIGELQRIEARSKAQAPELDPWQAAFAKALTDVRSLLAVRHERKPLFGTDAVELLGREFDGARWLVTGLVTRGGVVIFGGEPKTAKTWVATELAVAVATGTKTFGEFYAEHGRCAYFYAEDLDVQVRNRVRALLAGADRRLEAGRLHLQPRGTFIDVLVDDDLAWLVASVRQIGSVDVLVLDPLRDVHSGEEDKSDAMRNVMRRLRALAELLSCTVAVVHHAVKSTKDNAGRRPGQNLRGSSAIHGAMDCGLFVTEPDGNGTNVFTATVTSQVKGARSAGTFELELRVTDDGAGEAEKAEWTFTKGEPKQSAKTAKQAEADDDDQKTLAFVRQLHDRGVHLPRTTLRRHDERPVPEKRLERALDRLMDAAQICLRNGVVWPAVIHSHWSDAND
ncbi:MAG TPA: AAA family ATPase [Polyangiales bacterium]|jgi:replicative DNA helicase|nr:AAA family ATPase [Polyangiales bacterium]